MKAPEKTSENIFLLLHIPFAFLTAVSFSIKLNPTLCDSNHSVKYLLREAEKDWCVVHSCADGLQATILYLYAALQWPLESSTG